jgi:hypothetical protein
LNGGLVLSAAQSKAQIDAEIAEKSSFRTETNDNKINSVTPLYLIGFNSQLLHLLNKFGML